MRYVPPRRAVSGSTTIAVQAATQLGIEAGLTASNTFRTFGGAGLMTRIPHPVTNFSVCPLEDGSANAFYPILGYTGKGCYDPTSRQVLMMGSGAGGQAAGQYIRNTVARFRETANANVGVWDTPQRAYRGLGDTENRNGMIHMYDSNCINVAARRCYHKFGIYNLWFQYDIDNGTILDYIVGPVDGPSQFVDWWQGAEVIPTRGTQGALWVVGAAGSGGPYFKIWEYDFATQAWSTLFNQAAFGNQPHSGSGPSISYNPRAFGGDGGVMLGNNGNAYTINCQTLTLTQVSVSPNGSLETSGAGNGFCRDPVGSGWLVLSRVGSVVYRWNGSAWETRASWPAFSVTNGYIVIPIDQYGVVWMLSWDAGTGLLYRP